MESQAVTVHHTSDCVLVSSSRVLKARLRSGFVRCPEGSRLFTANCLWCKWTIRKKIIYRYLPGTRAARASVHLPAGRAAQWRVLLTTPTSTCGGAWLATPPRGALDCWTPVDPPSRKCGHDAGRRAARRAVRGAGAVRGGLRGGAGAHGPRGHGPRRHAGTSERRCEHWGNGGKCWRWRPGRCSGVRGRSARELRALISRAPSEPLQTHKRK